MATETKNSQTQPVSDASPQKAVHTLIITTGQPGSGLANAAQALAEHLDLNYKIIAPNHIPFSLKPPTPERFSPLLADPWPEVLITAGYRSARIASAMKKAGAPTFCIHLEHPHSSFKAFDLILIPEHDRLNRSNAQDPKVLRYNFNLSRISREQARRTSQSLEARQLRLTLKKPRITALIGGNNKAYQLDAKRAREIAKQLVRAKQLNDGSLLVTTSPRTPPAAAAEVKRIIEKEGGIVWTSSEDGPNPYLTYLCVANKIIVTWDSSSMIADACTTGKSISLMPLPIKKWGWFSKQKATKFERMHERLLQENIAGIFDEKLERHGNRPMHELERIAPLIAEKLKAQQILQTPSANA